MLHLGLTFVSHTQNRMVEETRPQAEMLGGEAGSTKSVEQVGAISGNVNEINIIFFTTCFLFLVPTNSNAQNLGRLGMIANPGQQHCLAK